MSSTRSVPTRSGSMRSNPSWIPVSRTRATRPWRAWPPGIGWTSSMPPRRRSPLPARAASCRSRRGRRRTRRWSASSPAICCPSRRSAPCISPGKRRCAASAAQEPSCAGKRSSSTSSKAPPRLRMGQWPAAGRYDAPMEEDRQRLTTRTAPPGVATPTSAPPDATPLVVPLDAPAPGRARPAAPLRREGPAKLTGEAKYADDLVFPGAWYGATIRSTEPHARLLGIDLDEAFDWKRVVVVTAEDIPGENLVSLISDDQPVLVPEGGEIMHYAEPVCLLAAADRPTLHEAKRHVRLRTEPLPPVFDPLASEQVFAHFEITRGDVEAALASADVVMEGEYRVGHQEQLYIENQAMIAVPREDGGVTVHGSCQCPYYIHKAMKRALAIEGELAVVVQAG